MRVGKRPRSISRRSRSAVPRAAISRATTSRGASSSVKRCPPSSRRTAPSPRSASERRSEESTSVVGWNCTNSRSPSAAPARYAAAIPSPTEPGGLVVRCQSAAAPPVASSVARAAIEPRSVIAPDATVAGGGRARAVGLALDDTDARMREHALGEHARDAVSGRGAARMDDAPTAVAALEPEPLVELDAELDEIADARGRLHGQRVHRARAAEPPASTHGVLRMQLGRVVVSHRGCDAALGERAGRREQRSLRDEEDVRVARRAQRADEARDAAPDDEEVGSILGARCLVVAHGSFRL